MFDFSEMLPVGMVAHGGKLAQIMADLAKQQKGLEDWEAFHYEKISDTAVELTGGIVTQVNGSKRWLEPHDCVTIPLVLVVKEMQRQGLVPGDSATPEPDQEAIDATVHLPPNSQESHDILHVSFALPMDPIGRQRLLKTFHLQADFFGAEVIACSLDKKQRKG